MVVQQFVAVDYCSVLHCDWLCCKVYLQFVATVWHVRGNKKHFWIFYSDRAPFLVHLQTCIFWYICTHVYNCIHSYLYICMYIYTQV